MFIIWSYEVRILNKSTILISPKSRHALWRKVNRKSLTTQFNNFLFSVLIVGSIKLDKIKHLQHFPFFPLFFFFTLSSQICVLVPLALWLVNGVYNSLCVAIDYHSIDYNIISVVYILFLNNFIHAWLQDCIEIWKFFLSLGLNLCLSQRGLSYFTTEIGFSRELFLLY